MSSTHAQRWLLFGGTGFIGQHLAGSVFKRFSGARVTLLDIRDPDVVGWFPGLDKYLDTGQLDFFRCDVREPIALEHTPEASDVLVNLAAVHREPGHSAAEYFETNIKGAENICNLAQRSGCEEIIFTSSISVYGEHAATVDENSVPAPKTPYGQSKLQAEQIHRDWAAKTGGRLVTIRPGVVFGPGEGGNVTRLVRESLNRNRAIQLKPDLAKAGIYIEELLDRIFWMREQRNNLNSVQLVNGVSGNLLHFNDYGKSLQALKQFVRPPLNIPISALRSILGIARPLGHFVSATSNIHPQRLLKLTRPNAIISKRLKEMDYPFNWPLDKAMADWLERGI